MMGLPAQYLLCKAMGDVLHSYTFVYLMLIFHNLCSLGKLQHKSPFKEPGVVSLF